MGGEGMKATCSVRDERERERNRIDNDDTSHWSLGPESSLMLSSSFLNAFIISDTFISTILISLVSFLAYKFFPFDGLSLPDFFSSHGHNNTSRAAHAFRSYRALAMEEVHRMQRSYKKISREHKRIGYELGYPAKLVHLAETVETNARVAEGIASSWLSSQTDSKDELHVLAQRASESDVRDV